MNWFFNTGLARTFGYLLGKTIAYIQSLFKAKPKKVEPIDEEALRLEDERKYPYAFRFPTVDKTFDFGHTLNNPFRGTLIIGGAGSGKTHSFVKTFIEMGFDLGYSGIIYDYKYPTLSSIWYNLAKSYPSKTKNYVINFENINETHRVNPLHPTYLKSVAYAEEYATAIITT